MRFAVALPWWGYLFAFGSVLFLAWLSYARPALGLTRRQRLLLTSLRAATLLLLVAFLLRPVTFVEAAGASNSLVPILIDVSRSMRIADGGDEAQGSTRIERAAAVAAAVQQQLGAGFRTELLTFGESLAKGDLHQLSADARRSDLSGALAGAAERYRGQRLAGVVVLSDGGDTASEEAGSTRPLGVPVFAIGIGNPQSSRDREVINATAGEPLLSDSSVDLSVSAASHGYGTSPIEIRVSENGRPVDVRRVSPSSDGAPVHEVFTVSPSPDSPTVYTVEIPVDQGELVAENNVRRVLVPRQGRKRRLLVVEGAPGFEHTFLKRALSRDPGLEFDSVVRKGQNEEGRDTFFVQAGASRSAALASGFPVKRADLFAYDAVIFGNPIEQILPLDFTDRRSSVARSSVAAPPAVNSLVLTSDGAVHPATRLAVSVEESRKRWSELPPMAAITTLGAPRAGAQVLAVTTGPGGDMRPAIVTQRYGQGRSMVFAGEASWRWRMLRPASDNTFELAWRQMARWIASGAGDRIEVLPAAGTLPGTTETLSVVVRNEEFKPIGAAEVVIRVKEPGGQERSVSAALADPREGRYSAAVRLEQPGVYSIAADVRRSAQPLGTFSRPMLVGGADLEMTEPRLNEAVLRRISEMTGGKYVPASAAGEVPSLVRAADKQSPPMEMRDIWNNAWVLAGIVTLLACEWLARRRAGLA